MGTPAKKFCWPTPSVSPSAPTLTSNEDETFSEIHRTLSVNFESSAKLLSMAKDSSHNNAASALIIEGVRDIKRQVNKLERLAKSRENKMIFLKQKISELEDKNKKEEHVEPETKRKSPLISEIESSKTMDSPGITASSSQGNNESHITNETDEIEQFDEEIPIEMVEKSLF